MPFAQSLNSLKADRGRVPFAVLVTVILVVVAWLLWFFFAPIPVYETGQVVGARRDGRLIAHFPTHTLDQLRPGQIGYVQLEDAEHQFYAGQQTATISQLSAASENGQIEVILFPEYHENGISGSVFDGNPENEPLIDGNVWVTIAVGQISPARLVLQASGQFVEAAPISLGRQ